MDICAPESNNALTQRSLNHISINGLSSDKSEAITGDTVRDAGHR